jgi:hypothetical protein
MNDRDKGVFNYEEDARICSLTGSGAKTDLELAEKLAEDAQFYCLTCKGTAKDPERLCSPALNR